MLAWPCAQITRETPRNVFDGTHQGREARQTKYNMEKESPAELIETGLTWRESEICCRRIHQNEEKQISK